MNVIRCTWSETGFVSEVFLTSKKEAREYFQWCKKFYESPWKIQLIRGRRQRWMGA